MIRVGITGGIGSGKTSLCKVWEELGARVIYADTLARELMQTDPELVAGIRKEFGSRAYYADGSLNRAWLAKQAFERGRVAVLNELVHPVVFREIDRAETQAREQGAALFAREAALLLDRGRPPGLDCIVVVTAPENSRAERVAQRDATTQQQVRRRMDRQMHPSEMEKYADVVVRNTGTLEQLRKRAEALYTELVSAKTGND